MRTLVPLLLTALRRNGAVAEPAVLTYLRTAYLREELRTRTYRAALRSVLSAFAAAGVPVTVLKGAALADTVYAEPTLRHCHDIDVLVDAAAFPRAEQSVSALGFARPLGTPRAGRRELTLKHDSGLPLALHERVFAPLCYDVPSAEIRARSQPRVIAGVQAQIPSPTDSLLHVAVHASYVRSRESLRWVCDAWLLVERCPDLDWELLIDCARRGRLALPLSLTLGYLAEELRAPIPWATLECLRAMASRADAVVRDAAILGARAGSWRDFGMMLRLARGWRARATLATRVVFPSPAYVRRTFEGSHPWLWPLYYVSRPLRLVGRYLRGSGAPSP